MPAVLYGGKAFTYGGKLYHAAVCPPCCDPCVKCVTPAGYKLVGKTVAISGFPALYVSDSIQSGDDWHFRSEVTGLDAFSVTQTINLDQDTCVWDKYTLDHTVSWDYHDSDPIKGCSAALANTTTGTTTYRLTIASDRYQITMLSTTGTAPRRFTSGFLNTFNIEDCEEQNPSVFVSGGICGTGIDFTHSCTVTPILVPL